MACTECENAWVVEFKHLGKLCKTCYTSLMVRRARKAVREFGRLSKNAKVSIVDDNSVKSAAAKDLFKKVFARLPLTFVKDNADVVVVPLTTDDLAEGFINELFNGELASKPKVLELLKHITDEELVAYARIQNIRGKMPEKQGLSEELDKLEARYPGIKFGLLKSREEIN